jgi:hypothetical protein
VEVTERTAVSVRRIRIKAEAVMLSLAGFGLLVAAVRELLA